MIPFEVEYGELFSSSTTYNHRRLTLRVALEQGETPEEVLECIKAFIDLTINDKFDRIQQAKQVVNDSNFPKDSASYTEAQRVLDDNKKIIGKAERIAKRKLIIDGDYLSKSAAGGV